MVTRAITIDAPKEAVWAWLIQHGQDRAGFYSYTWLENLTGADIHNANELRPEWQDRAPGDGIPMAREFGGSRNDVTVLEVSIVEPNRALVTTSSAGDVAIRQIIPINASTTRLIFRDREGSGDASLPARLNRWLIWEPTHFVMQHGMLAGIKARAEGRLHEPRILYDAARIGWLAAGAAVAGVIFFNNRRSLAWAAIPLSATLPAALLAHDADAALAGFIAAGIATAGALAWGRRWWPWLALIGAFVLLVLLLAADAYLAFGLLFDVLLVTAGAWVLLMRSGGTDVASTRAAMDS